MKLDRPLSRRHSHKGDKVRDKGHLISLLLALLTVQGLIAGCTSAVPTLTPTTPSTAIPSKTTSQPVLTWKRNLAEGCQKLILDAQGQAKFGPCDGPHLEAVILSTVERPRDLEHFLDQYQSFQADTPAGQIVFVGRGTRVVTLSEQRVLAVWASIVYQELEFRRSGDSWGMAIALNQEGPNPCSLVQIEMYGKVFANDCRAGIKPYPTSWLTTEQIDHLDAWINQFQVFEMNWNKDAIPMRLVFDGRGSQPVTESEQVEILVWVNELYDSIAQ
jgi:hypothetical protein